MTVETETQPQDQGDAAPPPELSDVEQTAVKRGFIPKHEWTGPEDSFVEADEFMKLKDTRVGSLKERLNSAEEAKKAAETATKELKDASKQFTEMMEQSRERDKKKYEAEIDTLKAQRREAVEQGDTEAFDDIDAKIDKMEEPAPVKEEPKQETAPPEFEDFYKRNDWYFKEPAMQAAANMFYDNLARNPNVEVDAALVSTEDYVKRMYPEKFQNQNRETAPPVDRGSSEGAKKPKGHTFKDLPASAQKAAQTLLDRGMIKNKQVYLDNFDWEQ